ncbi:MAG: tyrosine-type recombinase/integrase [Armatimonadota bacterium]
MPPSTDLRRAVAVWLSDGKAQGWSPRTLRDRETAMERFCWWLENEAEVSATLAALSPLQIRAFLAYAREPRPEGRYGTDHPRARDAARPATIHAYFRILRAFANFCLAEGLMEETPLRNVKAPRVPTDQVQPFAQEQLQALLDAARRSRNPERDVALILLLVDSGMRASEVMGLTIGDADRGTGELTVTGKGNKKRAVYMGQAARRALWRYLETERRDASPAEPLFASTGGHRPGEAFTNTGIRLIVANAGKAAKITGIRCSPHTLRHTFAVTFLRNGGNLFELQQLMGHTDLTVLRRYVALAEADLAQAHRQASPADRLKLK